MLGENSLYTETFGTQPKYLGKGARREVGRDTVKPDKSHVSNQARAKYGTPTSTQSPQIAPWVNGGSSILSPQDISSGSFLNGSSKIELSPRFGSDFGRSRRSDSPPDPMSQIDDQRRPSLVSEGTVSSQNSMSKASTQKGAAHKKIAGFFGEEGRRSSRSSETSNINGSHRETTQSSHHGSMQSNYPDGRPLSPNSSRPRTPLPSSDVTPWLFQDFKVSNHTFRRVRRVEGFWCFIASMRGMVANARFHYRVVPYLVG